MNRRQAMRLNGFTLIEVILVISLLAVLSSFILPNFLKELEERRLVTSVENLRSLIFLTRTKAMNDGVVYRIRFVDIDAYEGDGFLGEASRFQPVVEKEPSPYATGQYQLVTASWARDPVFLKGVRCEAVRLGKPVYEDGSEEGSPKDDDQDEKEENQDGTDSLYPELRFEPDGTCDWATFTVTSAPQDVSSTETEEADSFEVIVDGRTGQAWLQRVLSQEEKDLLHEFGLPPVLRMDFMSEKTLTEDNIRLIQESRI